ncbi:hypothetical protein ACS0TY_007026 [Phlomoides rotata]
MLLGFRGIILVTMSTPPILTNSTGSCKEYKAQCISHTKKVMFYPGMALLAMGIGGHRASLKPYNDESEAYSSPLILFCVKLPVILFISLTTIAGFFIFPYIKQWYLIYGVLGICLVCAILLFLSGWYKHGCYVCAGCLLLLPLRSPSLFQLILHTFTSMMMRHTIHFPLLIFLGGWRRLPLYCQMQVLKIK